MKSGFRPSFPLLLQIFIGLALAGSCLLYAQDEPATAKHSVSQSNSSATGAFPAADTSVPSAPAGTDAYSEWNQLLRDVAQMGMRAASPSAAGGKGGINQGASSGFSSGPSNGSPMQAGGRYAGGMESGSVGNPASGPAGGSRLRGGNSGNLGSLFQLAGDVSRGLDASGHANLGTALGVLPTLNQLVRGGLSLPMSSSFGSFRLSYQSPLALGSMMGSRMMTNGYGSGLAAYQSPHARSGRVDFSASALMGMGSGGASSYRGGQNGGMGGGMGQGGSGGHGPGGHGAGGQSEPSASVSLHLSF